MSFAVNTTTGQVDIVEKVGDPIYGSRLIDAEGNIYVPSKYGSHVVPVEVAEATSRMVDGNEYRDEQTGNTEPEAEPVADDGASEDDVDSGDEGEVSDSETSDTEESEA